MNAANRLTSVMNAEPEPGAARVVLLVTADTALARRVIRMLSGENDILRMDEVRPYQLPIATSVAQARSCIGRAVPSVILLDESVTAAGLFTDVLRDLARFAPIIFLAAPENLARWCALSELSDLVTQGRVECVPRYGDFVPLATRLIERHAHNHGESRPESSGPGTRSHAAREIVGDMPERVQLDPDHAPRDFGEVLRHEVNNPLTGILGNAELLLSRRDRIPADMVERLEVIAELAIRLRETIRRLSNALESRTARIPAPPTGGLTPTFRHRPPT
jgi:signal transduction histidine kinase